MFLPDRFLDHSGNIQIPDAFIPFSIGKKKTYLKIQIWHHFCLIHILHILGKRKCIGEKLGTVSNFIFFTNLLQNFTFSCNSLVHDPALYIAKKDCTLLKMKNYIFQNGKWCKSTNRRNGGRFDLWSGTF